MRQTRRWMEWQMREAIGAVLGLAVGVGISPLPIMAVILMLITPRARGNSLGFLLGWVLGLLVVGGVVLLVSTGVDTTSDTATTTIAWGKVVLGLLLVAMAVRQWRHRPSPGEAGPRPRWMSALDTLTPVKSVGMGAVLSGVNPKNLILTATAATSIAAAGLTGGQQVVVLLVFTVIASAGVAAPIVVYFAMGDRAADVLDGWKKWLEVHNAAITVVLLAVIAVVMVGQGLSGG